MDGLEALDELVRLVPPPAEPVGTIGDWRPIEQRIGSALPADYEALVDRYGQGSFGDFVIALRPSTHFVHPLRDMASAGLKHVLDRLRLEEREDNPFLTSKKPGGLCEWGRTTDGDNLLWVTDGPPDTWTVTVINIRGGAGADYDALPFGTVELILRWARGDLDCQVFAPAESPPAFLPFRS